MKLVFDQPRAAWFAAGIVAIALVVYDGRLRSEQQIYVTWIIKLRNRAAQANTAARDYQEAKSELSRIRDAAAAIDGRLTEMLRECSSREEFVVREGPRIAWSELRSATPAITKFGFFLPAGKHRFRYAVIESRTVAGGYNRGIREIDPRKEEGIVTCELPQAPEVYEVQIGAGNELPWRIVVIGAGDTVIHETLLPDFDERSIVQLEVANHSFAYPSEMRPHKTNKSTNYSRNLLPATDLALVGIQQPSNARHADILFWIESDAPPCMTAIDVAADYHTVATFLPSPPNSNPVWQERDVDEKFSQLFEPYNDSGIFVFRPRVIEASPSRRGGYGFRSGESSSMRSPDPSKRSPVGQPATPP